jgi:hypothetical protein
MDAAVAAVQQAAAENEQTIQDIVNSLAVVQTTGQSTSAVMSQKAVTDSLVGSAIAYDNSQSGLAADNVQGAVDELGESIYEDRDVEKVYKFTDIVADNTPGLLVSGGTVSPKTGYWTSKYLRLPDSGIVTVMGVFPKGNYYGAWLYNANKGSIGAPSELPYYTSSAFVNFTFNVSKYPTAKYIRISVTGGGDDSKCYLDSCIETINVNRIEELEDKVDNISVGVHQVINGTKTIIQDASSLTNGFASQCIQNASGQSFMYRYTGPEHSWGATTLFTPDMGTSVHVHLKVANLTEGKKINLLVANGYDVSGKFYIFASIAGDGEYNYSFDPNYYAVYQGFSSFSIWFNNAIQGAMSCDVTEFYVYQKENGAETANFTGDTAKELFEGADNAISNLQGKIESFTLTAPNGNKYTLGVDINGNLIAIPNTINKVVFFGNSLLLGFETFGMAASESTKDYYYLVTEWIRNIYPNAVFEKYRGNAFEGIKDPTQVTSQIQTIFLDNLSGDENLIIIQLGENAKNATATKNVFKDSVKALLQAIRTKCPLARIAWTNTWWYDADIYSYLTAACSEYGVLFVSMQGMYGNNTISRLGAASKYDSVGNRTISNVTQVTEPETGKISIVFTANGSSITADTIPVESYSLSGATLTYRSLYRIVDIQGVSVHPGDEGFRLIANKLLYALGLSDSTESYT